jgi:hypothetical protein
MGAIMLDWYKARLKAASLKAEAIETGARVKAVTKDTLGDYQVVKDYGGLRKVVALGLTKSEAERLKRILRDEMKPKRLNETGSPLFEYVVHKVTIHGREPIKEGPLEVPWIG